MSSCIRCNNFSFQKLWSLKFASDLFQLKFEDKWVHMYELAKSSLINRGNEIKSSERRSQETREALPSGSSHNYVASNSDEDNKDENVDPENGNMHQ